MAEDEPGLFEADRLRRDAFPPIDELLASCAAEPAAEEEKLRDAHLLSIRALDELKQLHSGLRETFGTLIRDVREDVKDSFNEEPDTGLKDSALRASKAILSFLRDSSEEALRLTTGGEDLIFLLNRMVQYRNSLLRLVWLEDPSGAQEDGVGYGVLVFVEKDGAYSCEVKTSGPVPDTVKDRTGVQVERAEPGDRRGLIALTKHLYKGRPGIVERRNVLLVKAPAGAGLTPRQILRRAATIYRDACRPNGEHVW